MSYWQGDQLVLHNYASGRRIVASTPIVDLLAALSDWRTAGSLASRLKIGDVELVSKALKRLDELTLVQRSDRGASETEKALETWRYWSPQASFFHLSTKNVPYTEPEVSDSLLDEKGEMEPSPPPLKAFEGAPKVRLPQPRADPHLAAVLANRRTWRRFSEKAVDAGQLATLLGLTWGVQKWAQFDSQQKLALKTSPSGGARHNLEAYVLAQKVQGLKPGLYHYDPDGHALEWLANRRSLAKISEYSPTQTWYDKAALVVFMTAVFARAQWRYAFPRAYRNMFLEAGHFCQTFCLLATSLNLAPFCTAAFAESKLERDLGIDGVTESVIYACGVGTRPRGVEWAPWPDTPDTPRLIPPASAKSRRRR